ncbi:Cytochrome b5-like Heme/Steroid binding domain [Musa troglodytarum]|uniref:Cytochrome b5-like Heme/Steroid binding domain n=1 Tax=Musa troglodytarum TaxID=320322 RepID=A0A9E7F7N4_9LILI|nr:Cytochrome b5-like Heme/Steroid binding domain [Musa troglodytarum]
MADSKIYHFDEVAKHKGAKDCWLIISGKVYDVTQFMDEHPGGDDVLLAASGKDATNDFEDIGHSNAAREMMDKYYIGKIDISTSPTKVTYVQKQQLSNVESQKAPRPRWRRATDHQWEAHVALSSPILISRSLLELLPGLPTSPPISTESAQSEKQEGNQRHGTRNPHEKRGKERELTDQEQVRRQQ